LPWARINCHFVARNGVIKNYYTIATQQDSQKNVSRRTNPSGLKAQLTSARGNASGKIMRALCALKGQIKPNPKLVAIEKIITCPVRATSYDTLLIQGVALG